MSSEFIYRMTVAVPEAMIDDANQFALFAGMVPGDVNTFGGASMQDAQGNKYAVTSSRIKATMLDALERPLEAPTHAPDVDLQAVQRIQNASVMATDSIPSVRNDSVVAAVHEGDNAMPVLESMGLSGL